MVISIIAGVVLAYWLAMFLIGVRGLPLVPTLPIVEGRKHDEPFVSIIVAAKDEEESIRSTLQSLLKLDYTHYEVIVVNDRSTDRTGQRLADVQAWARNEGIQVPFEIIQIEELPSGWLGKNHALYQGYLRAKGEHLLFTDADVVYQPYALRSAVSYFQEEGADHLTLGPMMVTRTSWVRSFVNFFLFSLCLIKPPWKPNDDKQHREGMGIGAFNYLSRQAYERIGTHRAIAMRPDDDLMLGMRVKQAGLKQRLVAGHEQISVEWYPSVRAGIQGLEKNMFAGVNYNLLLLIIAVLGQFLFFVWPYIAVWLYEGWQGTAFGASIWLMLVLYVGYGRKMGGKTGWEFILLPFASLLLIYILCRSTYLTYRQGGIYWRGTFYSLRELKAMKGS